MKERFVAVTPLVSLLLFLFSGFVLDSWALGMTFFLLIPISWVLISSNPLRRLYQLTPLISLTLFLWLAFGFNLAHPGWVVFFLIPLADLLFNGQLNGRKLTTLGITILYIVLGLTQGLWHPGWLLFLLISIINILFFPRNRIVIRRGTQYFRTSFFAFVNKEDDEDDIDVDIR